MQLNKVTKQKGSQPNMVRLCGEVSYDDSRKDSETYWFEMPEEYSDFISLSGNLWLAVFLPLAMTINEPIRLCCPIDKKMLLNTAKLMEIWKKWYKNLSKIDIFADCQEDYNIAGHRRKTAAFFSGGIDSFFTVCRTQEKCDYYLDELLLVWGFDIEIQSREEFNRMQSLLEKSAEQLDKRIICIATNLRQTRFSESDWGGLSHGGALAGVALTLEERYEKILISSGRDSQNIGPWGSTPITDRLFSTSTTEFIHYGAEFTRVQKTALVAQNNIALASLKVCANSRSAENCSNCNKCYRTMINFELLGVLDKCERFEKNLFNVSNIKRVLSLGANYVIYFKELKLLAESKKRYDIAKAIGVSLIFSKIFSKLWFFSKYLSTLPVVWRFGSAIQRFVRRIAIL